MTGSICTVFTGAVYIPALIRYPNKKAGAKISLCVESYEYVKLYDGNARSFLIYLIIHICINLPYCCIGVSRGFN